MVPSESRERIYELAELYGKALMFDQLVRWLPSATLDEFHNDALEDLGGEQ